MSFNNASDFTFIGHAINNVLGDQVNLTAGVVHFSSRADVEPTEYDEFERLKTGDIYLLEEIHRRDILACGHFYQPCRCDARHRAQRTIYSVELVRDRQSKFTSIGYKGQEAQEVWEEEFRRLSRNRSPEAWQLYGLNQSTVPFLIFHDKLVPIGHFYTHSFWGDLFVEWLRDKLGCSNESEIWLNTKGTLIKGPRGPTFDVGYVETINGISVPSSAEMLQDDISFRFFQKFSSVKLDRLIVGCAFHCSTCLPLLRSLFREEPLNILPENLARLRFDTVYSPLGAVARWRDFGALWKMGRWGRGLADQTVAHDGLIRFKLQGLDVVANFCLDQAKFGESWVSQSSRIISACSTSGTEEQCYIVCIPVTYTFKSSRYLNQQRLLPFEKPPPIYLFIYPLPVTVPEIILWGKNRTHFWSLDENGLSEMTEEECRRWEVPELDIHIHSSKPLAVTWPSHFYAAIRNWQVARGFDPTTADFARSLGHPEFDIISDNKTVGSRFEEVHGSSSSNPVKQSDQSVPEQLQDTPPPVEG